MNTPSDIPAGFEKFSRTSPFLGGIISTLADIACGYALHWSTEPAPNLVTVHLATEFLGVAEHGEWLEATGIVVSRTRRIACARASLATERGAVAHATALFHIHTDERRDHS